MVAQDAINLALKMLQALGATEPVPAVDSNDSLTVFNLMLDSWSLDNLTVTQTQELSGTLVIGQGGPTPYLLGTGGTFNTTRPIQILSAYTRDSGNNDYYVEVYQDRDRWNAIGNKFLTSQIVEVIFYDMAYPVGNLFVWPVPLITNTLLFTCNLPLTQLANLQTTIVFPPGYQLAFVSNLALHICAMFGISAPPTVMQIAMDSLARVKRINTTEMLARVDDAIIARPKGTYNIYRDSISRGGYT